MAEADDREPYGGVWTGATAEIKQPSGETEKSGLPTTPTHKWGDAPEKAPSLPVDAIKLKSANHTAKGKLVKAGDAYVLKYEGGGAVKPTAEAYKE